MGDSSWASFSVDRPACETNLEMQLRADKMRVLLDWGDRRDARFARKHSVPHVGERKCRECGRIIRVEENDMLVPHFVSGGQEYCRGTACSCPEPETSYRDSKGVFHQTVTIDGDCIVHGVKGIKSNGS